MERIQHAIEKARIANEKAISEAPCVTLRPEPSDSSLPV